MLACVIGVVAALAWARVLFIPLALATLLAFLLSPVVGALRRWGLARVPATLLVVLLVFSALGAAGWGLSGQLSALGRELPQHTAAVKTRIAEVRRTSRDGMLDRVRRAANDLVGELEKLEQGGSRPEPKPVPVVVREEQPSLLRSLPRLLQRLSTAGLTMLLVVFILIERQELRDRFIRLAGYGRVTVTTRALDEAGERISRYLLSQSLVNAGMGLTFGLGLMLIGVPYALLWGTLLALARYVPYVGVWIGGALPIGLSLAVFDSWREPALVIGLFVALELLISIVVEPVLYSQRAGVSKVALLTAIAFWSWLWGPIGLILATPLTVCLVVLAKHIPPLDFINVIISDEPALEDGVAFYQRLLVMDRAEAAEILESRLAVEPPAVVYDRVVVPALVHTRFERARGRLTAEEEQAVVAMAGELVDEMGVGESSPPVEAAACAGPTTARILGCPARDAADEVGLRMLRQLLNPALCVMEIVPVGLLSAEIVARATEIRPALLCVVALPPDGLAHARYLVKRLRTQLPETRIVVGRWGAADADDQRPLLLEAGADQVGASLAETRDQLLALVPMLSPPEGAARVTSELAPPYPAAV